MWTVCFEVFIIDDLAAVKNQLIELIVVEHVGSAIKYEVEECED